MIKGIKYSVVYLNICGFLLNLNLSEVIDIIDKLNAKNVFCCQNSWTTALFEMIFTGRQKPNALIIDQRFKQTHLKPKKSLTIMTLNNTCFDIAFLKKENRPECKYLRLSFYSLKKKKHISLPLF